MKAIVNYIEKSLAGAKQTETLYRYKKQLLEKMTDRANEMTRSGLTDEDVLMKLLISEFPDLRSDYRNYVEKNRSKKKKTEVGKTAVIGGILYVFVLVLAYLGISFKTGAWDKSWLFLLGGIFLLVIGGMFLSIKKICDTRKAAAMPAARLLLAGVIMLIATFAFLYCMLFTSFSMSWLIFLAAVAFMLIADAVFAAITKQKLAIINYLLYIPGVAAMAYAVLGLLEIIPWHPGWMIVLVAVLLDLVILVAKTAGSKEKVAKKQEDDDLWEDD